MKRLLLLLALLAFGCESSHEEFAPPLLVFPASSIHDWVNSMGLRYVAHECHKKKLDTYMCDVHVLKFGSRSQIVTLTCVQHDGCWVRR